MKEGKTEQSATPCCQCTWIISSADDEKEYFTHSFFIKKGLLPLVKTILQANYCNYELLENFSILL